MSDVQAGTPHADGFAELDGHAERVLADPGAHWRDQRMAELVRQLLANYRALVARGREATP